jgi:mRNA-degrading endonuclease RelE of RelBE toxin-antitoxin system
VESRTTRRFWRLFADLASDVQRDAKRAYRIFQENPGHPGLQFKKLAGYDDIYSARIGLGYRALATVKGDRVVWFWIGSHGDYDRLV